MNHAPIPPEPQQFIEGPSDHLVPRIRLYQAADLFGPSREIGIVHEGALYRLRVTRAGKLILTK
jgi:hemin uptake protein HemP